jgi:25S rRNA (cytosine2870-C5)-methyltransferase
VQLMKNTGLLVANDLKPERQKATIGNLHRLGVRNAVVVCYDGRKMPKVGRSVGAHVCGYSEA